MELLLPYRNGKRDGRYHVTVSFVWHNKPMPIFQWWQCPYFWYPVMHKVYDGVSVIPARAKTYTWYHLGLLIIKIDALYEYQDLGLLWVSVSNNLSTWPPSWQGIMSVSVHLLFCLFIYLLPKYLKNQWTYLILF